MRWYIQQWNAPIFVYLCLFPEDWNVNFLIYTFVINFQFQPGIFLQFALPTASTVLPKTKRLSCVLDKPIEITDTIYSIVFVHRQENKSTKYLTETFGESCIGSVVYRIISETESHFSSVNVLSTCILTSFSSFRARRSIWSGQLPYYEKKRRFIKAKEYKCCHFCPLELRLRKFRLCGFPFWLLASTIVKGTGNIKSWTHSLSIRREWWIVQ